MNKKAEVVLKALIDSYLKLNRPVSSSTLKKEANLPYSASTIRNYLQVLEKEGLIEKEHISSGSRPSAKAMVAFWQSNLPGEIKTFDIELLKKKCIDLDMFAYIKMFENQMLSEVYNFHNKYIIMEFENDEIVFKYTDNLYNFLVSLKGLYLDDIRKLFEKYQVGFLKKFDNLYESFTFNQKILYNYYNEVESDYLNKFDFEQNNVLYDSPMLIYKLSYKDEKNIEIVLIADVYSDFLDLITSLKGGEYGQKT